MPWRKQLPQRMPMLLDRRRLLQTGAVALPWLNALPWGTPSAASAAGAPGPAAKIKSCIVLFYYGGPSQLDTWDLKPDAPAEIRGEFQPISTRVPGLHVGQHLPRCSKIAEKLTVVRSMHHTMRNHNAAAVEALCGRTPLKGDGELLADDANSFPCYGAALSKLAPGDPALPAHVALPHLMYNVVVLPGQSAGYLGPAFNPLQLTRDPNDPSFRVDELHLSDGITSGRLTDRRELLASVQRKAIDTAAEPLSAYQQRAFNLLESASVRKAFDIDRESAATRERYGRNRLGQSLLLARRLVEAGVRFINVNDKVRNGQLANWDSHQNNAARLKNDLLPPADLAFSALIEDLDQRGLLESTLVVALGEFGRTPLINKLAGRDHWPDCFSVVLAGGGLRGGVAYGTSDKNGAYPDLNPTTPGDLAATIFWRFGLKASHELHDLMDRPQLLATGAPLRTLFSGSS